MDSGCYSIVSDKESFAYCNSGNDLVCIQVW